MKPTAFLRSFLALTGSALLAISYAHAAILYYDGGTVNIAGNGDSAASGLTGNWSTSLLNWDAGPVPYVGWNNLNNDIAFFHRGTAIPGPNPGTVSLTSDITVGGIIFNASTYNISTGANALTFGGTNNTVSLNNRATAATITGTLGASSSNMTFTAQNPLANHTLTFTGTAAGGWTGTTTVNAGMVLLSTSVSGINQVLNDTSAININGGTIQFYRTGVTNTNLISDSAAITVNGGGTLAQRNGDAGNTNAIETIGAVTVNSGQFNFHITNGGSSGSTIQFDGLTVGSTAAANFTWNTLGGGNIWINLNGGSAPADTSAGEIIGSWATTGTTPGGGTLTATPTDYAIYTGGNGTIGSAAIAGSAQSTWSTAHAATSNYTLDNAAGSAANGLLTATRNINTLRNTTAASAATATNGGAANLDFYTLAGNTFANGDVVSVSGTNGTTAGVPYYVVNVGTNGADTFQISTTPNLITPTLVNLGNTTAGQIAGGVTLSAGNNLGTNGILNGSTAALAIGGSGGVVTLPTTTSGELFVTAGAGAIGIDAPITDNGAGVLTLVKSGNFDLRLSGDNTYTGGTVANAGTVILSGANTFTTGAAGADVINGGNITYSTLASWGGTGRDITFNGTGTLTSTAGGYTGGTLTTNAGANAVIASGGGSLTFATTTGAGNVIYSTGANRLLNLGDASGLTGNLQARLTGNANFGTSTSVQFSSIGDAVGSALQFAGGTSDGNQALTVAYNGTSALTFNNRQVQILDRLTSNWEPRDNIIANNSALAADTWTINTDLLYTGGSAITAFGGGLQTGRRFILSGSNTGDNAFNGVISNGQNTNGLNLEKAGNGKWVLGGDNTYTGTTTVSGGTLIINGSTSSTSLVTVNAGATLGGSGSVGGDTSLNGILSPGNSPGTLTFGNDLTINNGAIYAFEAGDLTAVNGTLTLNDNWTLALGIGFQDGGSVTLFTYGTLTGSPDLAPTFDLANLGFTPSGTLTVTDNGSGSIILNGVSVIPEPRAALLGAIGLILLLRRRR